MLDTNMASTVFKGTSPAVDKRLSAVPIASICLSAISEAELLFGLAKKPDARRLETMVREFLLPLDILPWDSAAAACYAELRSRLERAGTPLGSMDMLIAAHALACDATLVTNDRAFQSAEGLKLADWTRA